MSLFAKFFKSNVPSEFSNPVLYESDKNENGYMPSDTGLKEIFIDENSPEKEFETERANVLKIFMSQNFFSQGYNDGYENHSAESLGKGINNLISEYQHLLKSKIEETNHEIYLIRINKLQCEGMHGNLTEQFDLRIEILLQLIDKCQNDYELAMMNKGSAELCINKFKDGFSKGQMLYFNEKFLAQSTGMFD